MSEVSTNEPLTGKALLKKLKEIPDLSRTEKARACGYSITKNDKTTVQLSEFMSAILAAKGIDLDGAPKGKGRGREASYRVSVHQNGSIVLGKAYTEKMGLKTGDELEIKLGYKHIHLQQLDNA